MLGGFSVGAALGAELLVISYWLLGSGSEASEIS